METYASLAACMEFPATLCFPQQCTLAFLTRYDMLQVGAHQQRLRPRLISHVAV
jgi:hypothetical protein